jgi:hypothetical protein
MSAAAQIRRKRSWPPFSQDRAGVRGECGTLDSRRMARRAQADDAGGDRDARGDQGQPADALPAHVRVGVDQPQQRQPEAGG